MGSTRGWGVGDCPTCVGGDVTGHSCDAGLGFPRCSVRAAGRAGHATPAPPWTARPREHTPARARPWGGRFVLETTRPSTMDWVALAPDAAAAAKAAAEASCKELSRKEASPPAAPPSLPQAHYAPASPRPERPGLGGPG
jgi:hypothetical protein